MSLQKTKVVFEITCTDVDKILDNIFYANSDARNRQKMTNARCKKNIQNSANYMLTTNEPCRKWTDLVFNVLPKVKVFNA